MKRSMLKRFMIGAALGTVGFLAACDDQPYKEPAAVEIAPAVEATAAEDAVKNTVAVVPQETPTPQRIEAIPPDHRSSEETVQPESDTLFY